MQKSLLFLFIALFSSCGYKASNVKSDTTISVEFIEQDESGIFQNALIENLSAHFIYKPKNAFWQLEVRRIGDEKERIGFRFDQNADNSKTKKLIGTEIRRILKVEVTLKERLSGKIVLGPVFLSESVDFDYEEIDSLGALSTNDAGTITSIVTFSGGQLDSIESAEENALIPLYRKLAERIVSGISRERSLYEI